MIWKRLSNIWKLSAWEPNENPTAPVNAETKTTTLIQNTVFIPYKPKTPFEEITS